MTIDYRGLHHDLCDMRNRAAGYLSVLFFEHHCPSQREHERFRLQLVEFEGECRDFIEEIWPRIREALSVTVRR